MKNFILNAIMNTNLLQVDTNLIDDAKDAYKVMKWKKMIPEAFKTMREQWDSLLKECFTEEELKIVNNKEEENTPEIDAKLEKFEKLFNELMSDDTSIDIKPISFETWHKLLKASDIKLGIIFIIYLFIWNLFYIFAAKDQLIRINK